MTGNKMKNIYLYTRYERFWHWLQTVLIILLIITGFEVHDSISLFGFKTAVEVHNFVGIAWLVAFAFFVFWVFTTGEWRQYIPTTKKMIEVVRYYLYVRVNHHRKPIKRQKTTQNVVFQQKYPSNKKICRATQKKVTPTKSAIISKQPNAPTDFHVESPDFLKVTPL